MYGLDKHFNYIYVKFYNYVTFENLKTRGITKCFHNTTSNILELFIADTNNFGIICKFTESYTNKRGNVFKM